MDTTTVMNIIYAHVIYKYLTKAKRTLINISMTSLDRQVAGGWGRAAPTPSHLGAGGVKTQSDYILNDH